MGALISEDKYSALEAQLKKYKTKSFIARYHLQLLIKGCMKDKVVLVDKWPEFSCVVITNKKTKEISPRRAYIYCGNSDSAQLLDKILRHVSKSLAANLLLFGVNKDIIDAVNSLYKPCDKKGPMTVTEFGRIYKISKQNIRLRVMPDDVTESCLQISHTDLVCDTWPHSEKFMDTKEWIEEQIIQLPSVCFMDKKGTPVAWALVNDYGVLAMLYVVPEYRRKGLGSLSLLRLAEKVLETDEFAYSIVDEANDVSISLHENNGFELDTSFTGYAYCIYTSYKE